MRGWSQYPVDPFLALQKLQTNIALAWEGDLRGRRHLLNPDDLALEVMRYEKAHLSLTENLDSVLHQLAALPFTGGTIRNPLFVLPVDDFDLNPPACLDLLRVLRMLALPRLFFLVLGDLDVANVLLNLKLSAELGRVAEGAEASRMLSLPPADVAAMAGEVAANAIRKLIPPAQRIQLAVPSLLEALTSHPLWRLNPPRPSPNDPPAVAVCVGSDDLITFNSHLRAEYQCLYDAMLLGGLSDEQARSWLERVRASGLESRFSIRRLTDLPFTEFLNPQPPSEPAVL